MNMNDDILYNRFGDILDPFQKPELVSEDYADENGEKWLRDGHNGAVPGTEEPYYLPLGMRIIRYGDEAGYYAAPVGTPYAELAMPYRIRKLSYHEYEVTEDCVIPVEPVVPVIKGKVAVQPAWPKERGGGVQFYFPDKANYKTVRYYAELGLLRRLEVEEWSPVIAEDMEHS